MELKKPPKIPPSVFLGNYCVRVSFLRDALCIPCWLWGCWMFFLSSLLLLLLLYRKDQQVKRDFLFREEISKICIGDRALSTGFTGVITSVICQHNSQKHCQSLKIFWSFSSASLEGYYASAPATFALYCYKIVMNLPQQWKAFFLSLLFLIISYVDIFKSHWDDFSLVSIPIISGTLFQNK